MPRLAPRWPQKPPAGTPIDWSSDLAVGLVALVPLWEGAGLPVEIVSGVRATSLGGAVWQPGPQGPQLYAGGNKTVTIQTPSLASNWTGPMSIACYAAPTAASGGQQNLVGGYSFYLGWNRNGTADFEAGYGAFPVVAAGVVDGLPHVWGATLPPSPQGGGSALYRDGVPLSTTGGGSAANAPFWIGNLGVVGSLGWAAIWNRALSAGEHAAIAANFGALFAPPGLALAEMLAPGGVGVYPPTRPRGAALKWPATRAFRARF